MPKFNRDDIIVLIPAFREELTISMVVLLSKKISDRVIVVDDGSPDRTSELARLAGAEVISQRENTGKAGALMTGFKRCRELNPKCVVMIDGDGQMDPERVIDVATPVLEGKADLVIGSRFLEIDAKIPKYRIIGQKMLNQATNIGSDVKISDSQSGFRALSARALENLDFRSESYNIESDMIVHFVQRGLEIVEVPITVRYDVPNGHKQKPFRHGVNVLSRMVSYIGYRKPLLLFGIPSLLSLTLGFIFAATAFSERIILFNWTLASQGFAGIAAFSVGIFLLFAALVLNSLSVLMQKIDFSMREKR